MFEQSISLRRNLKNKAAVAKKHVFLAIFKKISTKIMFFGCSSVVDQKNSHKDRSQ